MKKRAFLFILFYLAFSSNVFSQDLMKEGDFTLFEPPTNQIVDLPEIQVIANQNDPNNEPQSFPYTIGVEDIIKIDVIQPEQITSTVTVSPDGFISFPYIGSLKVKGKTLTEIQEEIVKSLTDGYMKYPIVSVILVESRSRKFFVYGEVIKPGTYPLEENTTVMRAISMAGGFTKYGSSSRVKVLKPRKNSPGYDTIKINLKGLMDGDAQADQILESGDIVVVSEGVF